jgi:hypothetical protein
VVGRPGPRGVVLVEPHDAAQVPRKEGTVAGRRDGIVRRSRLLPLSRSDEKDFSRPPRLGQ